MVFKSACQGLVVARVVCGAREPRLDILAPLSRYLGQLTLRPSGIAQVDSARNSSLRRLPDSLIKTGNISHNLIF